MTALEHIEAAHQRLREARELALQLPDEQERGEAVAVIDAQIDTVKATFEEVADGEEA